MRCNGKCHLIKQLEKVEEKNQEKSKFPAEIFKFKSFDNFVLHDYLFNYRRNYLSNNRIKILHSNSQPLSSGHLKKIYQPPEFS